MANTAHLFRRQSSRDLNGSHRDYTKTLDELELKVQKWRERRSFRIVQLFRILFVLAIEGEARAG